MQPVSVVQKTQNCKQPNLWPYGSLVNLQTPDVICGLHFYLHILESDSASSPWFMPVPFPLQCHQASGTSLIFLFLPQGKIWIFRFCTGFFLGGKKPHQTKKQAKKLHQTIFLKKRNKTTKTNTTNQKTLSSILCSYKKKLKIIEISHFKLFWVQCILQVPDS